MGFAQAGKVDSVIMDKLSEWVTAGNHGEMEYLKRHVNLKKNTDNVLPDAKTVISLAFSYAPAERKPSDKNYIAAYAYGEDYHIIIREILNPIIKNLQLSLGGKWRICIDSAPVAERYWALKSGIGKLGLNGNLIVEGYGSYLFLAEILTTLEFEPDSASEEWCGKCGKCISVCPGKALNGDGTMCASRCINYLTIEKKGDFSQSEIELVNRAGGSLYGCDLCMDICPHNKGIESTAIKNFKLREDIKNLTPDFFLSTNEEEFKRKFSRSPLLYAGFARLRRNAEAIKKTIDNQ